MTPTRPTDRPGDRPPERPGDRRGPVPGAPSVVAIGGGHGLAATLTAVRTYAGRLTAVVSVADDGGSSGRLRRHFAIPAPGDLRRCLVALAEPGTPWADAFEYRFPADAGSDLEGHALGNLVIAALAGITGDFGRALDLAASLLGAEAEVFPATSGPVDLAGEVDGRAVVGQVAIQESNGSVTGVHVVPATRPPATRPPATKPHPAATHPDPDPPAAPPGAVEAIGAADQVVIGPGSLYTSVIAACVVPDIAAALAARSSGRVYVANLRPELPETAGLTPADHVRILAEHGVAVDAVVVDPRCWPAEPGLPARHGADGGGEAGGPRGRRRGGSAPVLVEADLCDDPADGHDPTRLAEVLAALVRTP